MPVTCGCCRNDPKRPGGEFKFAGLLKEIALGTGFGLRYDFGFIVLRGDLGIALHTPYKNPDKSGYYNIPKFRWLKVPLGDRLPDSKEKYWREMT